MSTWPPVNLGQTRMEVSWPTGDFGEDRQEARVLSGGSLSLAGSSASSPPWWDCIHGHVVSGQTPGLGLRSELGCKWVCGAWRDAGGDMEAAAGGRAQGGTLRQRQGLRRGRAASQ